MKIIKRWINQKYYGRNDNLDESYVVGEVEFTDGTRGTRWGVSVSHYNKDGGVTYSARLPLSEAPRLTHTS
jgi:hypothetical protein